MPRWLGRGPLSTIREVMQSEIHTSRQERRQGQRCPGPDEVGLETGYRGREARKEGAWGSPAGRPLY